jgi:hypothetical protein
MLTATETPVVALGLSRPLECCEIILWRMAAQRGGAARRLELL